MEFPCSAPPFLELDPGPIARHGFPLEHEMQLQRLLHERGIAVAELCGWIDEPRAYVVDVVLGRNDFAASRDGA